jgi:hypothetical protein
MKRDALPVDPVRCYGTAAEPLESRIAPAVDLLSIGGLTTASFTDGDGDVITVRITGHAGDVDFDDTGNLNGNVENGESIASIAITGASADFAITISVDSSPASNGVVSLGKVTASSAILGLFTVADRTAGVPTSNFQLGSYIAPGLAKNGSINVSSIVGDGDGIGLQLKTLAPGTAINVTGAVAGTFEISKALGGALNIGGAVTSTEWTIGSITPSGSITLGGSISTAVTINSAVAGLVNIGGAASGAWTASAVTPTGSLSADSWSDLEIDGALGGRLFAQTGDITVGIGSLSSKASITSTGNLNLDLKGAIPAGAEITSGNNLSATLGGGSKGHLVAQNILKLNTTKGVIGGRLEADRIDITAKGLAGLTALAGSGISVTVTGGITKSSFQGGDDDTSLSVGGNVSNSIFEAESVSATIMGNLVRTSIGGSESDHSLDIKGSIIDSRVLSGSEDITLTVGGSIMRSTFTTTEDNINATVTGSVKSSQFDAGGNVTLTVLSQMADVVVEADGTSQLNVTGAASKVQGSADDFGITTGKGLKTSKLFAFDDLSVAVTGAIVGSSLGSANRTNDTTDSTVAATLAITSTDITVRTGVGITTGDLTKTRVIALDNPTAGSPLGTFAVSANITGNATASQLVSENRSVSATIGGNASGLTVSAASTTSLTVTGDLLKSKVFADEGGGSVILSVGKKVADSIVSSGSEDVTAMVGGDVIKSTFHARESSVSITVGGNLISSRLDGGGDDVSANITGNVVSSSLFADTNVNLTVGGNTLKSNATAGSSLSANISGDVLDSELTADNNSTVNINGDLRGTAKETAGLLNLTVGGTVKAGSLIESPGLRGVFDQLDGSVTAEALDLTVTQSVGRLARIQTETIADQNADNSAFSIGADFAGRLDVAGNFDTGIGGNATLIGGSVLSGAALNFGGPFGGVGSADQFIFGGAMLGTLSINSDLETDLSFAGNVNKLVITGVIRDTIDIIGKATFISTGSLFTAADDNDGSFTDGSGTVLGNLNTSTGHGTVVTTI